jgi:hemolysin D
MSEPAADESFAVRIRTRLFDTLSQAPEPAPRLVFRVIGALFLVLLLWAAFARLDIVSVAQGRLVPQTYVKIVQPSDAGIVREILVAEGDQVELGQVLVRLDPTENQADSVATERELALHRLQLRRIDSELLEKEFVREPSDDFQLFSQALAQRTAHRQQYLDALAQESAARQRATQELSAATEELRKLEKTLPSYQRESQAYEELAARQLVGALDAEARHRESLEKSQDLESQRFKVAGLEAAVAQSDKRIAHIQSGYRSDLHATRVDTESRLIELDQHIKKLGYRRQHLELRAPQAGVVKELSTTTVGAVVQPGTVLLTLVPVKEPLLAEVNIRNEDIGFVREGQKVRLKLATYPFQKYGMLEGVVKTVIADSRTADASREDRDMPSRGRDESMAELPMFKAVVLLQEQSLSARGTHLPLVAGMQLTAEILEGRRTVLEYLLSPVKKVASEAGTER